MKSLLDHALTYAEKAGWQIFPCKLDKSPYTKHGCKDATTDPGQIKKWWSRWPDASIGCATGPKSKIWILDIDLPGGPESLQKLISENGELPETRMQKTGSGGIHYFFPWNGAKIGNTSGKVGVKVDTRGIGGYIILSPSPHPSGNNYEWLKRMVDLPAAPKWLSDMVVKKEPIRHVSHPQQGGNSPYGLAALSQEIIALSGSGPGQRNDQLNRSGYALGQLVAGGELEIGHVENSLMGLAFSIGLEEVEARKTFKSGLDSGMQTPRKAPEKENNDYYFNDPQSNLSNLSNLDPAKHYKALLSTTKQPLSTTKQEMLENTIIPPDNLTAHIQLFIEDSTGCFTTRQIDDEFGLKTRKEKNARSWALNKMARKDLITKDRAVAGKWHIIDSKVEWVDLDAPAEETFPVILPFDLHNKIIIPPKAIIILAGSTNAGKTAFILNTLRMNRQQKYKKVYLMSEMGSGEYISRIRGFGEPLENWKSIKAASKSYDFNGTVKHHNPNGLTCIDYLEEIQGEYFKIASSIRDIYDAMGDGVAIIAIQKKSDQAVARGGEGTMEKSRLYMTLDHLCTLKHSIVCALKITKLKAFKDKNLQNHELHFEITRGSNIALLMDWTPSHKVNRTQKIVEYERGKAFPETPPGESDPILFPAFDEKGDAFRVLEKTIVKWGATFANIEVYDEVLRLAQDHQKKRFVKSFYHLSEILAKVNAKKGGS